MQVANKSNFLTISRAKNFSQISFLLQDDRGEGVKGLTGVTGASKALEGGEEDGGEGEDVTISGRTIEQGKRELLSPLTIVG